MSDDRPTWLRADVTRRPEEKTALEYVAAAQRAAGAECTTGDEAWRPGRAGVVGAGTMGIGIAMAFAGAGVPVTIVDRSDVDVRRGLERLKQNYSHSVRRGRISQATADELVGLISGATELGALAQADVIIEAVFEDLALKRQIFAELDGLAKPGTLLGTNTSGLDIDAIAAATKRPEDVIGTHFFSPANVMRLLEVVPGASTSPHTLARVIHLGRLLGKVPVRAGNSPSFIGNAMLADYNRETAFVVEEGAYPRDVDRVLENFGFAMGSFRVGDMAGLDVAIQARRQQILTRPKDRRYTDLKLLPVDMGRLGQKTGAGWYRYEPGSRTALPDPEMDCAIERYSESIGIERRHVSDEEILARCLYALVNRGAWLLHKGVAAKPSDIDTVYVTGYGFPAAVGGPLRWADTIGLADIVSDIERLNEIHAPWWEPAPLLLELARTGGTFGALNASIGDHS